MKKIFILLSVLSLVGCGHPYCRPDKTQAEANRDYQKCHYQAERDTGSMKTGADRGWNMADIIGGCMKELGYGLSFFGKCNGYNPDIKGESK